MHRVMSRVAAALLTFGMMTLFAGADDRETCRANWDTEKAIAACSRLISRNPNDAEAYFNRGLAYRAKDDDDRAIADFGQVIRLRPNDAGAYKERGWTYWATKDDYDRALADESQVIRLKPNDADAYAERGGTYLLKRDYHRAIADFDQLIRLRPNDLSYKRRGDAYGQRALSADSDLAKDDLDRAIADYSEAIRLNPDYYVYLDRAKVYIWKGDDHRAIADYDQAIRLGPDQEIGYSMRGGAFNSKGDYDRAIADFDQVIRLTPDKPFGYLSRGGAFTSKGDYDRAIADLDQAIRLAPDAEYAYSARGFTYGRKGDLDRATADMNKAIALNPKSTADVHSKWAAIYELRGDPDRAIAEANEAIRIQPGHSPAYNWRGKAWFDKGEYGHAISDYDQALKIFPMLEARRNRERAQAALAGRQNPAQPVTATAQSALPPPAAPSQAAPAQAAPVQAAPVQVPPHAPTLPPTASPLVSSERRVALVIGNAAYRAVPALPNPRRDAETVAQALRNDGFQTVMLVSDLSRAGMGEALRAFRAAADNADWALVYYAGHGIQIGKTNYLIPVDARLADERDVEEEAVSYGIVEKAMAGARVLRIIILDACRVDPFEGKMARLNSGRALGRGLSPPPEPDAGMLVVYSAKDGQVAEDGDGANSPFAAALVAQLKVPGREVRRVFDYVREEVMNATGRRQQPFTYGSLPGSKDYYFVSGK